MPIATCVRRLIPGLWRGAAEGVAGAGVAVGALALCLTPAEARQVPPDYGYSWAVIGAPGNRPANADEAPFFYPPLQDPPIRAGSVAYSYRMSRTEVSVSQWFEFVQAHAPYFTGNPLDDAYTGLWIVFQGRDQQGVPRFAMTPGSEHRPADMSWRYAARYCNWLHNGKALTRDAFETGVYDTSTFSDNPDGTFNDQPERSPGARFWIPSLDEWTKGMHYDPNKHGPGQEGYWRYPHGKDVPAISGYPEDGGETNAGKFPIENRRFLDVGSYPTVQSPWGLLDGSGGEWEWTEYSSGFARATRGSKQFETSYVFADRIDILSGPHPRFGGPGLRLASQIPTPSTAVPLVGMLIMVRGARRRRT